MVSTDKNKEVWTKYIELWDGIFNSIEKVDNKSGEYGKDFRKIKFNPENILPLNKTLKIHNVTITVRSVFEEDGKYYLQVFFRWMSVWVIKMLQYDIVDVSEGIGINKISASKECDICHYWYFADVGYKFQPYLCNDYRGISVMAYELKNTATLNIKGVDYRCIL